MKIEITRNETGRISSINAVSESPDEHLSAEENEIVAETFKKVLEEEAKLNETIEKEKAKRAEIIESLKTSLRETLSKFVQ